MDKKFLVTSKEDSVSFSIRIKAEDNRKLEEVAAKTGRSRNDVINMAIKFALANLEIVDITDK